MTEDDPWAWDARRVDEDAYGTAGGVEAVEGGPEGTGTLMELRSLGGGGGTTSDGCAFRSCVAMTQKESLKGGRKLPTSIASVLKSPYRLDTYISG